MMLSPSNWNDKDTVHPVGTSKFYIFQSTNRFQAFLDVKRKSKNILEKAKSYNVSRVF